MDLNEEAGLKEGQRLVRRKSQVTGFVGNVDIDEYDVVDESGKTVGGIRVTVHTNVKAPFHETRKVERI